MLSPVTIILNRRPELPKSYYDYGYVLHLVTAAHYPNGGWMSITMDRNGVSKTGSWPYMAPCTNIIEYDSYYHCYHSYGSSSFDPCTIPLYTHEDCQGFGFKRGEYLLNVWMYGAVYDAWYSTNYKKSKKSIIDYFKNLFKKEFPNDEYVKLPYRVNYSRGSGSNGTPSFLSYMIFTGFKKRIAEIYNLDIVYYTISSTVPANNKDYKPSVKEAIC